MSDESDSQEIDPDRAAIREEVSKMSIEEILAMKEKLGSKLFNQGLGIGRQPLKRPEKFKRENKNRPRLEPIAKRPVRRPKDVVGVKAEVKKDVRDPRFDPLCGEFDDQIFKDSYKFVDDIKEKELATLKKELKEEEDPERIEQIKYLIQRMENQTREKKKLLKQKEAKNEEKQKNKQLAKEGKAPVYMSKSDRKKRELIEQFEELKSAGKIDQYLKKKAKKNLSKDRKRLSKQNKIT